MSQPSDLPYTSPPRKLIHFFRHSRDQWKAKCQRAKATVKRLENRVRFLEKSKEEWKARAQALAAENAHLKAQAPPRQRGVDGPGEEEEATDDPLPSVASPFALWPRQHSYSLGVINLSLVLVVSACVHLRCVEKIGKILALFFSWAASMPCWSTQRLWLLRLGYYKLTRPKAIAADWAWIVDFTIQAGRTKCLVVVGVRLSSLGPERDSKILSHQDVEPIALVPMHHSSGEAVCQCLEEAIPQTGVPRQIIADEGSDVKAGIHQFQAQHPATDYTYDIKHFTAKLLEREFASDVTWTAFTQWATNSRQTLHQTAWSYLEPPAQRAKSRYLNMDLLVAWGVKTLAFLDRLEAQVPNPEEGESIRCKLGWLSQFRAELAEWDQILRLVGATETQVRRQGLFRGCDGPLRHQLRLQPHATERTIRMRWALIEQVLEASLQARPRECLLGSSEVLESIFGKFKYMQDEHARGGLTGMVLAIPALVAQTTQEVVQRAMETVPVASVRAWIRDTFGPSALAQRKAIYARAVEAEQKPDQFPLSA